MKGAEERVCEAEHGMRGEERARTGERGKKRGGEKGREGEN